MHAKHAHRYLNVETGYACTHTHTHTHTHMSICMRVHKSTPITYTPHSVMACKALGIGVRLTLHGNSQLGVCLCVTFMDTRLSRKLLPQSHRQEI